MIKKVDAKELKEYYQPLYNAVFEYRKVQREIFYKEELLDYFEKTLTKKKIKKHKTLKKYVKKNKKEAKMAWKILIIRSLLSEGVLIFIYNFLISLGLPFSGGSFIAFLVFQLVGLGIINKDYLLKAFKEEVEYIILKGLKRELETKNEKADLDEIEDILRQDLEILYEKRDNLLAYLQENQKTLEEKSTTLAEEILNDNNIDAQIDISLASRDLENKLDIRNKGLYKIFKG